MDSQKTEFNCTAAQRQHSALQAFAPQSKSRLRPKTPPLVHYVPPCVLSPAGKYVTLSVMVVEVLRDDSLRHAVIVGLRRTGPQHCGHGAEEGQG